MKRMVLGRPYASYRALNRIVAVAAGNRFFGRHTRPAALHRSKETALNSLAVGSLLRRASSSLRTNRERSAWMRRLNHAKPAE